MRIPSLIPSLAVLICLVVFTPSNAQVRFVAGGVQAARTQAIKEQKLYFAFFYTDWCLPCKWMDDNTFKDKELSDFIAQHYVGARINIDDFDGHNTRLQYNVEFLPTVLIFDQGGDIKARFEESVSAKKLLEAMRKERFDLENKSIRISAGPPTRQPVSGSTLPTDKKSETEVTSAPVAEKLPAPKEERPVTPKQDKPAQPKEADKPAEKIVEKPRETPPQTEKTKETTPPVEKKEPAKETFVLEEPKKETNPAPSPSPPTEKKPAAESRPDPATKPTTAAGTTDWTGNYYSVQVGTFSRFENADRRRNEFREIFGEGAHIKIEAVGADTIYKVMLGRYQTYDAAQPLLKLLREQGMDGFIKEVKQD